MRRMDLSFVIAWLIPSSAVISLTAQTPVPLAPSIVEGSTVEGPTPTPMPPTPAQIFPFLADPIEVEIVAIILAIIGLRWKELGRVRCWFR
jgi:hypothetical protein